MPGPGPRHGRDFHSKPKNFKGTLKRMVKDFKPMSLQISIVVLLSVISAVVSLAAPIFLKDLLSSDTLSAMFIITNDTTGYSLAIDWDLFFQKFGLILGVYVISALLSWLSEFVAVSISGKYAYLMRARVQRKVNFLPLSYFDKTPYGDTLSVATNDVDNISRNLQTIITQIFSGVTLFLGASIAMLVVDWRVALVAFASLPLSILVVLLIGNFSGKRFVAYRKELGELNGKVEEYYSGFKIVKLFNRQDDVEESFSQSNVKMAYADKRSQFLSSIIFPATNFINNLAYVGIAVVAGLVSDVATMVAFFLFLNSFTRPFQQIGQIFSTIQSVVASGERIYALLDEKEVRADAKDAIDDPKAIKGSFNFDDVFFQYDLSKPLIENFTLNVNQGDTIAIVGPTGAGKTTLVNLIMRFYEINNVETIDEITDNELMLKNRALELLNLPKINRSDISVEEGKTLADTTRNAVYETISFIESMKKKAADDVLKNQEKMALLATYSNCVGDYLNNGNIYIDGSPIKKYSAQMLRSSIGMVLQDTWLFKGTIRENLLFGNPSSTEEEMKKACEEAHIDHFIETLPKGYDFELNEDGTNISQGQRQLMTIARALLCKPKIMILDEATSSVDTRTEKQIQDTLDSAMKNRTSFVIAHRLSTIKNAKTIIAMKKGHIVEVGSHKELLAKNGFYAELYNSQFVGINPMAKEDDTTAFDS
jgi:ABC-type multidrug transport system fused ATPase/permease subunit